MNTNKKVYNSLKYISMITQLGIAVITPAILCTFGAIWLKNKFGLGDWIVIAGIILGIASGFYSLISYMQMFLRDARKDQQEYEDKFRK